MTVDSLASRGRPEAVLIGLTLLGVALLALARRLATA